MLRSGFGDCMNKKKFHAILVFGLIGLVMTLSACSQKVPTPDMDKVNMMIAETVAVQRTKTEIARPTNTPTVQPTATNTPEPPTPMPTPTSMEVTAVTLSAQPISGTDGGTWVSSSPADKATQLQGQTFKVTVKLMNIGTSTWTTDYSIRYIDGDIKASPDTYRMPVSVPPGAQIDIIVTLTAPTKTGMLRGNWGIFNSANVAFSGFYFEYDIQ